MHRHTDAMQPRPLCHDSSANASGASPLLPSLPLLPQLLSSSLLLLLLVLMPHHVACHTSTSTTTSTITEQQLQPPVWPEQFKAVMFQNRTSKLALVTLYYDWKLKANLNIISSQLGAQGTVWDLEHDNGTSFIFSRDTPVCKTIHFEVGILTPDWLRDAKYLGQTAADFVTDVWTKAQFINYYADKDTGRPVRWTFLWSSAEFHTMQWEEGVTLPREMWQAPAYCFNQSAPDPAQPSILDNPIASGRMLRLEAAHDAQQQQRGEQLQLQGAEQAAAKLPTS